MFFCRKPLYVFEVTIFFLTSIIISIGHIHPTPLFVAQNFFTKPFIYLFFHFQTNFQQQTILANKTLKYNLIAFSLKNKKPKTKNHKKHILMRSCIHF
jgi:hypothetical protein